MQRLLSVVAVSGGRVLRTSLEVLSHCVTLAERHGAEAAAIILAESAADYVDQLAQCGVHRVITIEAPIGMSHVGEQTLAVLEKVVAQYDPQLVALANCESVKHILGSAAIRLGATAISDVTSFDVVDGVVEVSRPAQAGKTLVTVRAARKRCLVSVRAGSFEIVLRASTPKVDTIDFSPTVDLRRVLVQDLPQSQAARVDLSEATVVVAAGRGVQDAAAKALVEELADVLGAAVGATRAVVESGLFPASMQIGQTGKIVSPELYIGVGVSGALQHVAGIMASRVIVAINKDSQAPLFEIASYGLVGDLYKVLPALIECLRTMRGPVA